MKGWGMACGGMTARYEGWGLACGGMTARYERVGAGVWGDDCKV